VAVVLVLIVAAAFVSPSASANTGTGRGSGTRGGQEEEEDGVVKVRLRRQGGGVDGGLHAALEGDARLCQLPDELQVVDEWEGGVAAPPRARWLAPFLVVVEEALLVLPSAEAVEQSNGPVSCSVD